MSHEGTDYHVGMPPPSTTGREPLPCGTPSQINESGLKGGAGEYATGSAGSINQVDSVAVQSDKNTLQKGSA